MCFQTQIQAVQQEIDNVLQTASDLEASLASEEQAGHEDEVKFLRGHLQQLYKERVALQEKKNLFLRAQQRGEHYSLCYPLPLSCMSF